MLVNPEKTVWSRILYPFWVVLYWIFLVVFALCALVVNVSAVVTSVLPQGKWRYEYYQWLLRTITRGWFLFLGALGILRVRYIGFESLSTDRSSIKPILVANHPNLFDIFLFYKRLPRLTCIYKSSLRKTLIKNSMGAQLGYISNASSKEMIREAAERVRQGEQFMIFPEGTRTDTWPLNAFKSGASGIARRAEVGLQTVVIHCGSNFLSKRQPIFSCPILPIFVRVELGEIFYPKDYATRRELNRAMEDYFKAELAKERTFK